MESQIKEAQARREAAKAAAAAKASNKATFDEDIYQKKDSRFEGYDTSIGVGGGGRPDDEDDDDLDGMDLDSSSYGRRAQFTAPKEVGFEYSDRSLPFNGANAYWLARPLTHV